MPGYNEEEIIEDNVLKVYEYMKDYCPFEIIIVDDNSDDDTNEIGTRLAKEYEEIKYIECFQGPSRRENLAVAFSEAKGDIIIFMDMDLATDIFFLPRLIHPIKMLQYDIAIGNRYDESSYTKRELSRLIISRCYNWFIMFYFGSKLIDHQCGFKAFKKDVILDLVKDAGYDEGYERGWFWDAEILIRAQDKGYEIIEIPVVWFAGKKTSYSLRREIKMIKYMLRW